MINSQHNHFASFVEAYLMFKCITMIEEIKSEIARQFTIQIFTFNILSSLRILDLFDSAINAFANAIAHSDTDFINSMFQTRDIHRVLIGKHLFDYRDTFLRIQRHIFSNRETLLIKKV
jgi:hypothetical protein